MSEATAPTPPPERPDPRTVLRLFYSLLDGAEGYVSEYGNGRRYWNEADLTQARRLARKFAPPKRRT